MTRPKAKISRTFRLDQDLSNKLDNVIVKPYTYTWHLEQALKDYFVKLEKKPCTQSQ